MWVLETIGWYAIGIRDASLFSVGNLRDQIFEVSLERFRVKRNEWVIEWVRGRKLFARRKWGKQTNTLSYLSTHTPDTRSQFNQIQVYLSHPSNWKRSIASTPQQTRPTNHQFYANIGIMYRTHKQTASNAKKKHHWIQLIQLISNELTTRTQVDTTKWAGLKTSFISNNRSQGSYWNIKHREK